MAAPAPAAAANASDPGKSGLRQLKAGEVLFEDGANADSLFIIQKGQLRLYKPKGKGFVEIAVLRAGEVIGEMAFFDEDGSGRKRSCAAAAMTGTEVIEISFPAFGKTMAALNPWFKTIINTLAARLRKANSRIRELESNSTAQYGKKAGEYEFIKASDLIKILGTIFLVFKSHGDKHDKGISLHKRTVDLYGNEIYGITDAKLEAVLILLKDLGWMEMLEDADKLPHLYVLRNLDAIRSLFIFYNTEKQLGPDKKMKVGTQCETFLEAILVSATQNPPKDIPNLRPRQDNDRTHRYTQRFNVTSLLLDFKNRNLAINADHLEDARSIQVTGDRVVENGEVLVEIDLAKLQKLWPTIKFVNAINKLNRERAGS